MKIKIIIAFVVLAILGALVWWRKGSNSIPNVTTNKETDSKTVEMAAIRTFMADPNLELSFVNTDFPMPYFRVGKVTKTKDGENMEAVEGWTRQVNIYHQKKLLNGLCSVYEYHVNPRSHSLVAVIISGLKPSEIEEYKKSGVTCSDTSSIATPKITKAEAETVAMSYIARGVKDFDQIKDQFVYSHGYNGESHQWLWEDKGYKLPEGLEGRPYSYPTIRITVNGNKQIQYWNTVSLFEN